MSVRFPGRDKVIFRLVREFRRRSVVPRLSARASVGGASGKGDGVRERQQG